MTESISESTLNKIKEGLLEVRTEYEFYLLVRSYASKLSKVYGGLSIGAMVVFMGLAYLFGDSLNLAHAFLFGIVFCYLSFMSFIWYDGRESMAQRLGWLYNTESGHYTELLHKVMRGDTRGEDSVKSSLKFLREYSDEILRDRFYAKDIRKLSKFRNRFEEEAKAIARRDVDDTMRSNGERVPYLPRPKGIKPSSPPPRPPRSEQIPVPPRPAPPPPPEVYRTIQISIECGHPDEVGEYIEEKYDVKSVFGNHYIVSTRLKTDWILKDLLKSGVDVGDRILVMELGGSDWSATENIKEIIVEKEQA